MTPLQAPLDDEQIISGTNLTVRPPTPLDTINLAISKGMDVSQLKELFEMQRQFEKDRAAEAFSAAMTKFQGLVQAVRKERKSGDGTLKFKFANYDDIMASIQKPLSECGLVPTFTTEIIKNDGKEDRLKVVCRVRHGTHFEETPVTLPVPEMKVNDTQRMGAAIQYGKRYAIVAALNIPYADADNDAADLGHLVTAEEVALMQSYMPADNGDYLKRFLVWAKAESLDKMLRKDLARALWALSGKKKKEEVAA